MHTKKHSDSGRQGTARILIASVALAIAFGFSISAQAQEDCTFENWDNWNEGAGAMQAGHASDGFRRYGGPCSLRIDMGNEAWVENSTEGGDGQTGFSEPNYIARFYAFFEDVSAGEFWLFGAFDSEGGSLFNIDYNRDEHKLIVTGSALADDLEISLEPGLWQSIQVHWSDDDALVVDVGTRVAVNTFSTDLNGGGAVSQVQLGNLNGGASGILYLDDFDSRRNDKPGRLLRADATGEGNVGPFDVAATRAERFNLSTAPGQPDCTEDGTVGPFDVACVRAIRFQD